MRKGMRQRFRGYNLPAPGANTNILPEDLPAGIGASAYIINVVLGTASVFNVRVTDGTTPFTWGLNSSLTLSAGDLFSFSLPVQEGLQYNFQVETDGVVQLLNVDEVFGGQGL